MSTLDQVLATTTSSRLWLKLDTQGSEDRSELELNGPWRRSGYSRQNFLLLSVTKGKPITGGS